jgi:hypothetical protein
VIASESCAFVLVGATYVLDIKPGEWGNNVSNRDGIENLPFTSFNCDGFAKRLTKNIAARYFNATH